MEVFFLAALAVLLVYVIIQRIRNKSKEDFEQRDN